MKITVAEIFNDFVSLVYPHYCLACKTGLAKGEDVICSKCILELPRTHYHADPHNPVFRRLDGRILVQHAFSFFHFRKGGKVQQLLHELKYNNHPEIGVTLGRVYADELLRCGFSNQFDVIIPIPLHASKRRRRGYNQSEEFAKGLSEILKAPCLIHPVERIVQTDTQTRKSKLMRWRNVSEVFRVNDIQAVSGIRILLVDDVITTGATVEACGRTLLEAGCSSLSIASMAYAEE
jgi:ComF family protein